MSLNNMRPIHPGEVLREEFLNELEISANALAIALRVPASRIDQIVKEKRSVSADTAMRLARYFGGSADFWMNLQSAYDLAIARRDHLQEIESQVIPMAG